MKVQVAATRYPLRPAWREGESLGGWCWQIHGANEVNIPATTRAAALRIRTTQALTPDNALCQLIGFERLKPHHEREISLLVPWSDQPSPNWYAWSKRPRFCSLCMAEDECHLSYWDLPLVSACALHGCRLSTKCHSCQSNWRWATMKRGWRCHCNSKVVDGQATEAPKFEVCFSRVLCAAVDALVPRAVKAASCGTALLDAEYCTRDVYETLGWLLKVRRVLTDESFDGSSKSWPITAKRGARMAPGSWEKRLMMGFPHSIDHKARQTLRWFFKGSASTLVDLRSIDRWRCVKRLMNVLDAERNPMLRPILSAIERVQLELFAGMQGRETVLFNPQLSQAELRKRLAELNAWVRHLPGEEAAQSSRPGADSHLIAGSQVGAQSGQQSGDLMVMLNALFDAARHGIPRSAIRQMTIAASGGQGYAS